MAHRGPCPYTVRTGHTVIHCASAAAVRDLIAELRPMQGNVPMVQTGGTQDSAIIAKLAVVNQGLLQVIADECGKTFSGLGKADTTIRRLVGNKWSKRAASMHAAYSEVRHIHELDPDAFVGQFRIDIQRAILSYNKNTSDHKVDSDASSDASTQSSPPWVSRGSFDNKEDSGGRQEPRVLASHLQLRRLEQCECFA